MTFDLYQGKTFQRNVQNECKFGKYGATVLKNIDCLLEEKRNLSNTYFVIFSLCVHYRKNFLIIIIEQKRCKDCPIKSSKHQKKGKTWHIIFCSRQSK